MVKPHIKSKNLPSNFQQVLIFWSIKKTNFCQKALTSLGSYTMVLLYLCNVIDDQPIHVADKHECSKDCYGSLTVLLAAIALCE